jgi:hypothetical protein
MFATGLVYCESEGQWIVGGTAAAYSSRHCYVTAAHCVPEGCQVLINVTKGSGGRMNRPAREVHRHETADLALVLLDPAEDDSDVLDRCVYQAPPGMMIDGGDFIGYGYVMDGLTPVGRTFKGHLQRTLSYPSPRRDGVGYFAVEMSIRWASRLFTYPGRARRGRYCQRRQRGHHRAVRGGPARRRPPS